MKHQVKSIIKYRNLCLAELEYGLESEDFRYRNGAVYSLQWLNVAWFVVRSFHSHNHKFMRAGF